MGYVGQSGSARLFVVSRVRVDRPRTRRRASPRRRRCLSQSWIALRGPRASGITRHGASWQPDICLCAGDRLRLRKHQLWLGSLSSGTALGHPGSPRRNAAGRRQGWSRRGVDQRIFLPPSSGVGLAGRVLSGGLLAVSCTEGHLAVKGRKLRVPPPGERSRRWRYRRIPMGVFMVIDET